ncbi:MAG: hypothetical protein IMF01_04740 [Proteobacteria bacterium]|nr:hypothetical protein [Pseudomonadota bacterium]
MTFSVGDLIILIMSGRYGKYGEIKRFERLRKNRRDVSCGQGRSRFLKDRTGKSRLLKKHFRYRSLKD